MGHNSLARAHWHEGHCVCAVYVLLGGVCTLALWILHRCLWRDEEAAGGRGIDAHFCAYIFAVRYTLESID